ncbi:hypothetical protein [uncultured Sphingobacterium sp.]|uniref:hypothetical protein n=1 Tax=uncultured Sphingobacterium sp. TaxID=182688 RepID=UPI0025DBEC33|nr:hypothetical protein [uncultured Sphingobacterium sp.]
MRIKILLPLILIANFAFAQSQLPNTLTVKIANLDQLFFRNVRIVDQVKKKNVALKDGIYTLKNGNQIADISINRGFIDGKVTVVKGDEKTNYTIEQSEAKRFTVYTGDVLLVEGYRDSDKAYYREYYPGTEQKLKREGWMSLNKNKHYGLGISKEYFENGQIAHIANMVTDTFTDFYPNGNKKKHQSPNVYETFKEDGTYDNRQYTKNNIHYNDYYYNGKLYRRSYKNKDAVEISEYYDNGVLQKKEAEQASGQIK